MKKLLFLLLFIPLIYCSSDNPEEVTPPYVQSTEAGQIDQTPVDVTVTDSDGDGVSNENDFWPNDPSMSEDYWGKIVDFKPEIFFASDISETIINGFTSDLTLATQTWGNYGPLEYWILGNDINAANSLSELYCQRRTERNQQFFSPGFNYESCLGAMMYPNNTSSNSAIPDYMLNNPDFIGRFEEYRSISDNLPSGSAGLNGDRGNGFHYLTSSLPFAYEPNEWNISKEGGSSITVFHEYFHVVNAANVYTTEYIVDETGNSVRPDMGPTSMIEGSANYLSEYTIRTLIDQGLYTKSSNWNVTLRDVMKSRMEDIQNMISNCPDFNLANLNYGNSCDPYTFGMWGIAWLLNHINNQNAYQEVLFPTINDLGYYSAFEQTFGLSFNDFNEEFKTFLQLNIDEQLEIIPDI